MTTDDGPVSDSDVEPAASSRGAQLKARQQQVVAKVEQARNRLEEARPRSIVVDSVFRTFERDVEAGGVVLSGAVAFRVFLFLVPYVFVLVGGLGLASGASTRDPGDLARSAGISGLVAHAIKGTADYSLSQRILALAVGGFAVLVAARAAIKVLRVVHSLVWGVPVARTGHRTRDSLVLVAAVTALVAITVLVGELRAESFALGAIASGLTIVVPFGFWIWASWHLPHADVPLWALVPGAVLFAVGAEVLHLVTVYWIAHEVASKSDTYGAIGVSLAVLLWAYLLGRVITAAAVLNATLWRRNEARARVSAPRGPTRRADAPTP